MAKRIGGRRGGRHGLLSDYTLPSLSGDKKTKRGVSVKVLSENEKKISRSTGLGFFRGRIDLV